MGCDIALVGLVFEEGAHVTDRLVEKVLRPTGAAACRAPGNATVPVCVAETPGDGSLCFAAGMGLVYPAAPEPVCWQEVRR